MEMKKLPDKVEQVTETTRMITIDGEEFDADFLEGLLWEGLAGTDGCFESVGINPKSVADKLVKIGIAREDGHRNYYRGPKYEEAKILFHKAMYESEKKDQDVKK